MTPSNASLLKEFRPTILFLAKFIGLYLIANVVYGFFITYYEPGVDPVTHLVTQQSSHLLNALGWENLIKDFPDRPTTYIQWNNRGIVSVYEGCNGINVMIVFLSFIAAFGPLNKTAFWFSGVALVLIHIVNVLRVVCMFWVVIYINQYAYFVHKYLFTATIYVFVLMLWMLWVKKYAKK